jgi:expansin (peptidoglycan-binding protein)
MFSSNLLKLSALALAVTAAPLSKRAQYTGRATFYNAGDSIGNCGWQSSGSEFVVALNTPQYGSTSDVSQYCGQTVTITYQGNTQQAKVVDSCPTCPYGGLDMSTSLFSALTDGDMGLGEMQVQWSFGSGRSNKDNVRTTTHHSSPTTTASPIHSKTSTTSTSSSTSTSIPTNIATKLQTGVPQWWKDIGNASCPDVKLPAGIDPISVAPSGNAEVDTLPSTCGKWVQITNPATNKSTVSMLTNYNLGGPRGTVYLGNAYLKIANMTQGSFPMVIHNVTWGFLN